MLLFKVLTKKEKLNIFLYTFSILIFFGILTGVWDSPFFARKIPTTTVDYYIFVPYALVAGLYLGIANTQCKIRGSGIGGLLGALGFACPTCNILLVSLFGNAAILAYFEPYRHLIGFIGLIILTYALHVKIKGRINNSTHEKTPTN
ncbi:MAG: hypothetical protein KAH04_06200 [Psychrilyobacter sp.]|nr:hypothetical protein [Psychrilyobacter sp.]